MNTRLFNKYNLIIQAIAKDEDHIINEWIVHHILLGVEHIYLYDDFSKIPITEAIKNLPSWILDKVTVYRLEENDNYYNEAFLNSKYYDKKLYEKCITLESNNKKIIKDSEEKYNIKLKNYEI